MTEPTRQVAGGVRHYAIEDGEELAPVEAGWPRVERGTSGARPWM